MDWRCRLSRAAATHALHGAGDGDGELFDGDWKVRARNNADAIHLLDWMRDGDLRSSRAETRTNERSAPFAAAHWMDPQNKIASAQQASKSFSKNIFFLKKKFGAGWTRDIIIRSGSPPQSQIHHRKNLRLLVSISGCAQNQARTCLSGGGHMAVVVVVVNQQRAVRTL